MRKETYLKTYAVHFKGWSRLFLRMILIVLFFLLLGFFGKFFLGSTTDTMRGVRLAISLLVLSVITPMFTAKFLPSLFENVEED